MFSSDTWHTCQFLSCTLERRARTVLTLYHWSAMHPEYSSCVRNDPTIVTRQEWELETRTKPTMVLIMLPFFNTKTNAIKCKLFTPEFFLARGLYPYFWKNSLIFMISTEFFLISTFAAFMKPMHFLLSKLALSRRVRTSSFWEKKVH